MMEEYVTAVILKELDDNPEFREEVNAKILSAFSDSIDEYDFTEFIEDHLFDKGDFYFDLCDILMEKTKKMIFKDGVIK